MHFYKLFKPKACSVQISSATKEAVLREILECMVAGGALEASLVEPSYAALIERERLASTGVGQGVAVPHVKVRGLTSAAVSLCVHGQGAEWAAVDGEPVHVLFTVLRPEEAGDQHDPERHLEMMRWIARLSRDRDFRCFAAQAKTRTELVDLLKEMSRV